MFFVIGKFVGVELLADGWIFGFLFFVLIENPFKGRSVPKFVVPSDRGDSRQLGIVVKDNLSGGFVGF